MGKTEGGLGIRKLRLAQHSLMAKHVFTVLNNDNKLWVDIFKKNTRIGLSGVLAIIVTPPGFSNPFIILLEF